MTMTAEQITTTNRDMYQSVRDDSSLALLEKAQGGKTTLKEISKALDEYKRLYKAGIASSAEIMTLHRAYPNDATFQKEAEKLEKSSTEPVVLGGPASVELVDREGHLITTVALEKAFNNYMKSFRTRNAMVLHSDVQVGWALPAYINKAGQIFKSGVNDKGLFFITEMRNDTKISDRVKEQINEGKLKSYSIAGSATKMQNMNKGLQSYMQVDDLELAEVTVCEKGVNQGASFDLLKSNNPAQGSCADGSCLSKSTSKPREEINMVFKSNGNVNFSETFFNWLSKENGKASDPLVGNKVASILENYHGRERVHHNLLDEQGFPKELESEFARYTPVMENPKYVPWVVNEAGEEAGAKHYEEALTPPKAVLPVTKAFLNWMSKQSNESNPFAIATAQAKKEGFDDFSEGSEGRDKRNKIAEDIKGKG
jgi:HK97 family phage prohead protease